MQNTIQEKLEGAFPGSTVSVECFDADCGKYGVTVVAPQFKGVKLLDRHRLINETLAEELAGPLHALTISAKPSE